MSGQATHDIVITGAGLVTCLGLSVDATWQAVRAGRCGIGPSTALQSNPCPDKGYGQAKPLPADALAAIPDGASLPREVQYLRHAINQAVSQAGLIDSSGQWRVAPDRIGIVLGTTLHGMRAAGLYFRKNDSGALTSFLAGSTAQLSTFGMPIRGQSITTCAACASGLMSIGLGMSLLERGELDVVLAGGYDPVSEYAYGGFNSLRLVAESAQQPFSKKREGLKLAEGYGIVVLERRNDASASAVTPIGRVLSCTASADAHHLSQPHPEGVGAARAMREALDQAGITPDQVAMITAHATATPDNDRAEALALSKVFGDALASVPVSAMKSGLGHTLGAAGTVELILTLQALREGLAPPLANVAKEDVEYGHLNIVTGQAAQITGNYALITSLGFGGSNACAVIQAETGTNSAPAIHIPQANRSLEPVITGVGVVYPGAIGSPLLDVIRAGTADALTPDPAQVTALLNTRRTRRMSDYVKYALAATALACRDSQLENLAEYPGTLATVMGTTHGSAKFSEDYYKQLVEEGVDSVNPLLFAEGVPNAGTAHLSMMLNLTGPCQTLIGSRTAGLDAVRIAAMRIASGEWDAALVGGAEEHADMITRTYQNCGLHCDAEPGMPFEDETGFRYAAGAVTLMIESRAHAQRRGVPIYATLSHWGQVAWGEKAIKPGITQISGLLSRVGIQKDTHVLSSANATWLDRIEAMAIRVAASKSDTTPAVSSIAPWLCESFSATALLGLAAVVQTKQCVGLAGSGLNTMGGLRPGSPGEPIDDLVLLASDYNAASTVIKATLKS